MKNIFTLLSIIFSSLYAQSQCTLNLKLYIESYYVGSGNMRPVLKNCGGTSNPNITDSVTVELHDTTTTSIVVASVKDILMRNGTMTCTFSNSVVGNSYYIAIKHRMSIETWSALPVAFSSTTNYDFSTDSAKAYGNNMIKVDNILSLWALYSSDMTQDGNIDQIDFPILDFGINQGLFGCYVSDSNGDGNVDLIDFPVLDANICRGTYVHRPY